ncbi:MAG TPA: SRPBCC family protein [Thermoanaerobaculia bacterium]
MKIVLWILALLVVAVVGVLLYATTRPDSFRVERQATIHAPADQIVPLLTDFHAWSRWSPWEKLDPAMKRTWSGAASGKGAAYAWDGNSKAGAGRMEITEASPAKVAIQLDFSRPFTAHNLAEFTLEPQGDATRVTWAMSGPMPYVSKVMCVFIDMDKLIGKDFETGLANLQATVGKP